MVEDDATPMTYRMRRMEISIKVPGGDNPDTVTVHLPTELILVIFNFACPPTAFLMSSLQRCPSPAWSRALRTKKALMQVCKAWYSLALPYLYESIVLDLSRQVLALARTIRESQSDIAPLIKHVHFILSIPVRGQLPQVVLNQVAFVLKKASNVITVVLGPSFSLRCIFESDTRQFRPVVDALMGMASTVRRLEYDLPIAHYGHRLAPSMELTASFSRLVSLTFPVPATWHLPDPPMLDLLDLEQLHLSCSPDSDLRIIVSWTLPQLQDLTITGREGYQLDRSEYEELLMQHGEGIEYLDVSQTPSSHLNHILGTIHLCPKLSHLVVTYFDIPEHLILQYDSTHDIGHPSLANIDFWVSNDDHSFRLVLSTARSSLLKNARTFDGGLFPHLRRLPRLLGPDTNVPTEDTATYSFAPFHIVQTRRKVVMAGQRTS
ncbi:hypothetical protein OBBRIDRAFT_824478 [Obba rivulosa]|uniref:F-box domain-containing protein n=1 Tax=Obba rivulosa TaxID=1052685 RepID=A0A8E2B575_9APHY|nr:hypothetical protein OBBRIDRAFT_824478 [Obba rivulosa]